jgi:hypothetical protein
MTMTEATKTPLHLWIVGGVSTLWNAFGTTDYFMTRTRGAAWIDQMMPGIDSTKFMAYIDGFPMWASIGWACGVWGALAGAIVGIGYQLANPVNIPEMTDGANGVMPYVIIAIAAGLLWYARRQKVVGVLW